MKPFLFLAFLLLPFAVLAQSETCPRVWRSGDSLLTDPAPAIQWLRDGQAIPGGNERWFVPTEAGRYAVQATGTLSPAYVYARGRYALAGYVFDEQHRPVEGATVSRGRFSATTDEKGRFVLWIEERKPEETTPVIVSVEKVGHWRNVSRQYVSAFETTETQVMLHTKRVTNRVDATRGGELAYRGFTLQLPPNAVQTESGTPYAGTILLSVEGTTPSDPDFGLRMPGGDFAAIDEGGNDVMLYSYGYLSAEMTTESGEKLELRPEARATLRFFLPYTETHRPDSVPLWHFEESTAVWKQEDWSFRNGSIYEGEVSHFSSWNCDYPVQRGTCKGRVIDCNGEAVKGGWVRVGQRGVATDSLGNYWAFVPGGITFDAWAAVDTLREISVLATEERTLEDLTGGRVFDGLAVWNPVRETLDVNLWGNVPTGLRLSIDGGQTWGEEQVFLSVATLPSSVLLSDNCAGSLRTMTLSDTAACELLDSTTLFQQREFHFIEEALAAVEPVYRLDFFRGQGGLFRGYWGELLHFSCLQALDLSLNSLFSIPDFVFEHGNMQNLQYLLLARTNLNMLPENIGNLNQLVVLDLRANYGLRELPASIANLTRLKGFSLSQSQLLERKFPEVLSGLTRLEVIAISQIGIEELPEFVSNFTQLHHLDISWNAFNGFPPQIFSLPKLQYLDLGNNQIRNLPENIGDLTRLRELHLQNARLADLPESIGDLSSLRVLELQNNQLTDLPDSIANLADTLADLFLTGNAIPVERRAAIQALLPNTRIVW